MPSTQHRHTYALILLLGLAWIFVSADTSGASTAGKVPAPQQGFLAPDFELKTTTGETIKLSDLSRTSCAGQLVGNVVSTLPRGDEIH